MTTSDIVRRICVRKNIRIAELCRYIGQTPQNFNKKLKRETISYEEMIKISEVLGVDYEQVFIFPDGEKIGIRSRSQR